MPTEPDTDHETETASEPDGVDAPDADAVVDALFEDGVLTESPDGAVALSEEFEHRRSINDDTYQDMSDEAFRDAVANAFGLSADDAAARIEDGDVSRDTVASYFALKGHYDDRDRDPPASETLAAMAEVVAELEPASPVPGTLRELSNDDYRAFIEDAEDAVVFVFKRNCDPCDATKELLPDLQAVAPPNMWFAGVDGDAAPDLVREFEVSAAPTTLFFRDGELVESLRGHRRVDTYEETFDAVYE